MHNNVAVAWLEGHWMSRADCQQRATRMLFALLLLCPLSLLAQSDELFPRPAGLEPAINFWIRVYTEVDTRSGFLHDSVHLDVVYASLPRETRRIEAERTRIREALRVLATGKRSGLTQREQEVLDLWPDDVSNETLAEAAANVRWQLGQSDRFLRGLQRSGAYRDHIARVIRDKDLPSELGVLPHVESSFNPSAYSSASAAGMWQFGRATGQRFMRIDHIVDERMDPYIATDAAMSLLEYNYSVLGTWPLALTAYNHGAGGIARAVRQTGTTDIEYIVANYRGRAFGFASRNFYAQFLAVNEIESRLEEFFGDVDMNPAPEFIEVRTDAFIDAEVFASSVGISLEQLRADNPALRPVVWDGNKRIPRDFPVKVRAEAVASRDLLALIPGDFKFAVQTPDVEYVVARGDSLSVIARRFDTTVSELVSLNQLASRNRIQIGQRLLLPQDNVDSQQLVSADIESIAERGIYTVRRGDTVSLIAARYNVAEDQLLGLNGIRDRNRIYPGQELRMPGYGPDGEQLAAIQATDSPQPPTEVNFGDDELDSVEEVEDTIEAVVDAADAANVASVGRTTPARSAASAVVDPAAMPASAPVSEDRLPPAAVLPDNRELDVPVSVAEEDAVALDPAVDVEQSSEQLSELLEADPSDYSVAANNTVEIQASETLGHYAEWLDIRAWDIRRLNNMAYRDPVIIGDRLRLDFSRVDVAEFERRRRDFHSTLQQAFFANYRIQGVEEYRIRRGDNIGSVASRRYNTPVWLLRQYNPELDFTRIQIGQSISFPLLEPVAAQ